MSLKFKLFLVSCTLFGGISLAQAAMVTSDTTSAPQAATSNVSSFDLSIPADAKRCQMTQELATYVDTVAANDLESLQRVRLFLVSCRDLVTQQMQDTQQQISTVSQPNTQH